MTPPDQARRRSDLPPCRGRHVSVRGRWPRAGSRTARQGWQGSLRRWSERRGKEFARSAFKNTSPTLPSGKYLINAWIVFRKGSCENRRRRTIPVPSVDFLVELGAPNAERSDRLVGRGDERLADRAAGNFGVEPFETSPCVSNCSIRQARTFPSNARMRQYSRTRMNVTYFSRTLSPFVSWKISAISAKERRPSECLAMA